MIQANEIKIGNRFIRELHNSHGLEYDHDFILTEEWMGKLFGDNVSIALQDLNPIPLSKEVLFAYGFEKENNGWHINKPTSYTQPYFSLFDKNYGEGELSLFLNGSDLPMPEIKYLHELQNLYYALTKTKIIYQPK